MYKFVCYENDCANKSVIYYLPEVIDKVMCGGCKNFNSAIEMSQTEFDEVFDYDPYAQSSLGIE